MKILKQKYRPIARIQQIPQLFYLIKWTVLSALAGGCIGSASALLLVSLQWATEYRESHLSWHTGIYTAQVVGSPKNILSWREKGSKLHS